MLRHDNRQWRKTYLTKNISSILKLLNSVWKHQLYNIQILNLETY